MRVVRAEIIVEYDSVDEKKQGNRERNASKWTNFGKHQADGKHYVYYRKQLKFKDRVESFDIVRTNDRYSNFIKGKVYEAVARSVDMSGNPTYYEIIDEDGDSYHVGGPHKLKRGWKLYADQEEEVLND